MSPSRLDRLLSISISRLYLLLLFLLPLLFSMKSSEVFEFPKVLFVYAMTVLIVSCWIARMIVNKRIIYTRTPLDIPIYFFLLSQLFSTFFSIDVHTSTFGYYSRWNGGLLSTIAYTLLYAAYTSNKRQVTGDKQLEIGNSQPETRSGISRSTNNDVRITMYVILASATFVALYAILQRLGVDKNLWVQDVVARVFSTQGQPNWLAGYLVMVLPLSWAFILSSRSSVNRLMGYSVIPLIAFAIAFTRSRSGLIGFVVADLTFWSVMVWNYMSHQRSSEQQPPLPVTKKKYRLPTIVYHLYSLRLARGGRLIFSFLSIHTLILVLVLLTNNPAREWLQKKLQSTDYGLQPSESSSLSAIRYPLSADSITPSSDIRKIVWTGALQLVKERPWFGWGPETFAYTYWRVRPVEHNLTSEWNFLYNKAHNEWLNLAANSGLFGLGTHLLLLGWFTGWCLKKLQAFAPSSVRGATGYRLQATGENQRELVTCRLLLVATISALLGAEIVNFFGFSTVTTQAYSYLFMAIAVAEGKGKKEEGRRVNDVRIAKNELRIPFTVYCLLFIVALSALYLISQISILFLADMSYNRGKQYAKAGYLPEALAATDAAVDLVSNEPVFRSELAETQGVLALTTLTSLKDASLKNFAIVGKQNPVNVSFVRTRARVTYALGSLDPSLYDQGITLMQQAMKLAPTDPKIPYNLGVMLEDRGQMDEAKLSFEKALELKPDYEEAKIALSPAN